MGTLSTAAYPYLGAYEPIVAEISDAIRKQYDALPEPEDQPCETIRQCLDTIERTHRQTITIELFMYLKIGAEAFKAQRHLSALKKDGLNRFQILAALKVFKIFGPFPAAIQHTVKVTVADIARLSNQEVQAAAEHFANLPDQDQNLLEPSVTF